MTRILVVDDSKFTREMLRSALEPADYDVMDFEPESLTDFLELAPRFKPHVTLMDYKVGDLNGVQLARLLRERVPETRVLMVTAHWDAELDDELRGGHVDAVLNKPVGIRDLLTAIHRALRTTA